MPPWPTSPQLSSIVFSVFDRLGLSTFEGTGTIATPPNVTTQTYVLICTYSFRWSCCSDQKYHPKNRSSISANGRKLLEHQKIKKTRLAGSSKNKSGNT